LWFGHQQAVAWCYASNWPQSAITTSARVRPLGEPTASTAFTTSIPFVTFPNTTCLPSNQGVCDQPPIPSHKRSRGKTAYSTHGDGAQEELRAVGAWTSVGHGQHARASVLSKPNNSQLQRSAVTVGTPRPKRAPSIESSHLGSEHRRWTRHRCRFHAAITPQTTNDANPDTPRQKLAENTHSEVSTLTHELRNHTVEGRALRIVHRTSMIEETNSSS
jgi:hypothetical protein